VIHSYQLLNLEIKEMAGLIEDKDIKKEKVINKIIGALW